MIAPGQVISLSIDKPAAGGRMIARLNGQVVLVSGAIPGERVRARVERTGKGVAYAETVEIEEASPDRRSFTDASCGGSLYGHVAYARQLELKGQVVEDAFRRIGRMPLASPPAVMASPEDGYRMRARLHARNRRIGFFREGTHAVCDPRATRQLLAGTCDVLEALAEAIDRFKLDAIREVELSENVDASERVLFLDAAGDVEAGAVEALAKTAGLTGLVSAFGASGSPTVVDQVAVSDTVTVSLSRHVLSFFQGNRHLLAPFVAHVVRQVPRSGRLLDLYAGVGLFALSAAATRGVEVTAVEGDRFAAADLASNAAAANAAIAVVHQSVEEFVGLARARSEKPSTIVVDPPRTGMSPEALAGAIALGADTIIYVSCDAPTLARDARRLLDARYAIGRIEAFDLFPNTPHVETVVVFQRSG